MDLLTVIDIRDNTTYFLKENYDLYLIHDINYSEKPELIPENFGLLVFKNDETKLMHIPTKFLRIETELPKSCFEKFMNHSISRRYKDWEGIDDYYFIGRFERLQYNFLYK